MSSNEEKLTIDQYSGIELTLCVCFVPYQHNNKCQGCSKSNNDKKSNNSTEDS